MMTKEPLKWPNLNAEEEQVFKQLSPKAIEKLEEAFHRTSPFASCREIWDTLLDEDEHIRLGNDVSKAWQTRSTLGIWMHLKGYSNRFAALTNLADEFGVLQPKDAKLLERETSLGNGSAPNADRPTWDRSCGKLVFQGEVVREVRVTQRRSNIQKILDAFHNASWPGSINNPFRGGQQQLHDAVYELNQGLLLIQFHTVSGAVTWSLMTDSE